MPGWADYTPAAGNPLILNLLKDGRGEGRAAVPTVIVRPEPRPLAAGALRFPVAVGYKSPP